MPILTDQNKADLMRCAEDILLAREAHFPATIADLYDPAKMPENLRAAHERNDETLEGGGHEHPTSFRDAWVEPLAGGDLDTVGN